MPVSEHDSERFFLAFPFPASTVDVEFFVESVVELLLVQLLVDDVTVALAWQVELETVVEFAACAAFAAGPSGLLASISV